MYAVANTETDSLRKTVMDHSSTSTPTEAAVTGPLLTPGFNLQGRNTAAHVLTRSLLRHGVTHVFGQSIPSLLMLTCEELGIVQVAYRTENAGGYMADGYARISNKVGVVAAQNGPAATLLVPAMAEAMKASIPMVALVQDVVRSVTDKNAFQEFDHIALFHGVTKWAKVINNASRVEDYVDMAFTIATSGRPGPVALMLPADMLLEDVSLPLPRKVELGTFPLDRTRASSSFINEAAGLLANAKRPLIIAGGGVHLSGASRELAALQEQAHIPVATTTMGKGAVSDLHTLSVGVVGAAMGANSPTRHMRKIVSQADVILLVGNRTNQNGTDSYSLYPTTAKYIHIDIDGQEIGRNYEALRLNGDAKENLDALREALVQTNLTLRNETRPLIEREIQIGKDAYLKEAEGVRTSVNAPIRPERVMYELDKILAQDDIVVADASYSSLWVALYLTSRNAGQRFVTPRGMAGLGWGFPMAIGAKLAKPESRVYCLAGDGGFGHVWSELETAKRMNIKLTLIVLNNGILGFSKHADRVRFGTHSTAVNFAQVDHRAVAIAAGCHGIRVESPDRLQAALEESSSVDTTTLIEVMCDENAYPPLTPYTKDLV